MNWSESEFRLVRAAPKARRGLRSELRSQLVLTAKEWIPTSEKEKSSMRGRSTLTVVKAGG